MKPEILDYIKASEGDSETIKKFIDNKTICTREHMFGQTVLHLLLANYVMALADTGVHDRQWVDRFEHLNRMIISIMEHDSGALNIKIGRASCRERV